MPLLVLFFAVLVVGGSFAMPAVFGPQAILLLPIFLSSYVVYGVSGEKYDWFIKGLLSSLVLEVITGVGFGAWSVPFIFISIAFAWLKTMFDIRILAGQVDFGISLFNRSFLIFTALVLYSIVFVFYDSGYDLYSTWEELKGFLDISFIFYNFLAVYGMTVVFRHLYHYENS